MMRDTFGRDAVLLLLFFGMLAIALAIALSWSRVAERTAYARGYAAAVDSVLAQRTMHDDIAGILRAHGIRYSVVLTLRGEADSTVAVVHAGVPR